MPQWDERVPGIQPVGPGQPTQQGGGLDIGKLLQVLGMQTGSTIPQGPAIVNQPHIPMQPLPQKIRPDLTQGNGQVEFGTKGGRNRAALQNIFGNATKMVVAAEQNKEQKETRALALDLERIMIASQNPDDPHNKQVIDDILSDSKRRKKISEALNIQFGPVEDKRDPQVKAALSQAMQKVQAAQQAQPQMQGGTPSPQGGQPDIMGTPQVGGAQAQGLPPAGSVMQQPQQNGYAQQLARQMPQVPGANPQLQIMQQLMKIMSPMMVAGVNAQSRENAANTMAVARVEAQKVMSEARSKDVTAQNEAKLKAANIMVKGRLDDTKKRIEGMLTNTKWKIAGEVLKKQTPNAGANQAVGNLAKEFNALEKQATDVVKEITSLTAEDKDRFWFNQKNKGKILEMQQKANEIHQNQQRVLQQMQMLNLGATSGDNTSGAGTTEGGSTQKDDSDSILNDILNDTEGEE